MSSRYKDDKYLQFLSFADHEDLEILSKHIIFGKDEKNKRRTEGLSTDENFIKAEESNNLSLAWKSIACELQLYGGDSIVNFFRGGGVLYREILDDVRKKLKVDKADDIVKQEDFLLIKIMDDAWEKMDEEQKREIAKEFGLNGKDLAKKTILPALQIAIRSSGFAAYKFSVIVANAVAKQLLGRGLALGANAGLVRGLAVFAGPIGWAISGILTFPLVTGPAYRVTIPATIQVAYMRKKYSEKDLL